MNNDRPENKTQGIDDLIPYQRLEELEERLRDSEKPLFSKEAFGILLNIQEIVEKELLPVGSEVQLPGQPGYLTTITADQREMVVATGQEGWLTVLAENGEHALSTAAPLTMSGYDAELDEVVTAFAHPRVIGARADLYVAVRRWDLRGRVPTLRMYRANAWWEHGQPRISPGIEDALNELGAWPPLDLGARHLPHWLAGGPLSMASSVSPFDKPPPMGLPDRWSAIDPGPARAVAWDGERMVWLSCGPRLVVRRGESQDPIQLTHSASDLALGNVGEEPVAVVCGPDWGLQGAFLECDGSRDACSWKQSLNCHPVTVTLLQNGSGWPDVVVAARDGRLRRLRHVHGDRSYTCRRQFLEGMRRDLNLDRISDVVRWLQPNLAQVESRIARALVARFLVRMVDLEPFAGSDPTGSEVREVAGLLGGELTAGTECQLGRALGTALTAARGERYRVPWPDPETGPGKDLVQDALASWTYDEAGFALQEQVDTVLAEVGNREDPPAGPALLELLQYRPRNRWDEWETLREEEKGSFRRLAILADFATERYLLERQESASGRWDCLTSLCDDGDLLVVGAGQDGMRIVRLSPSGETITHPAEVLDLHAEKPGLVPACLATASGTPPLFMLGEHAARVRFFDFDRECKVVHGQSGSSCTAVAVVPGCPSSAVLCLLGWNEGRRSFLELWQAQHENGSWTGNRVAFGPLGLHNVGGLGVLGPVRDGSLELVAGDALTGKLARLRVRWQGQDLVTEERWQVALDAGVTAVHVDPGRGLVLAGSVAGIVWALDVETAAVHWTFRSRHAVRSIQDEVTEEDGGYVVLAPPDDMVVVSRDRKRLWRRRHRGVYADLAVTATDAGPRLLLGLGSGMQVFRMPDREIDWAMEARNEHHRLAGKAPQRHLHTEAVEVAAALEKAPAGELIRRHGQTTSRRARLEIIRLLAVTEASQDERADLLSRLSWRETWALLFALPPASTWEQDVVNKVLVKPTFGAGDRSSNAWTIAAVELIRRVAARAETVAEVGAVLFEVPIEDAADSKWLALEAGQAWLAAVVCETGQAVDRVAFPTLLEYLDQLPPALATRLPLLVRTPGRAKSLARLAQVAGSEAVDRAELLEAAEELEKEGDSKPVRAMAAALRFAGTAEPPWEAACELIALVRDVRAQETWAAMLQPALLPADLGLPPGEDAPLARQVDWLDQAVARRSVEVGELGRWPSWRAVAHRVARLLDERLRWAYRQRLDHVEGIGRLRPEMDKASRPSTQRLDISLRLIPECRCPVGEAEVRVLLPDLMPIVGEGEVQREFYRSQLRDGEAPERLDLSARLAAPGQSVSVAVEVRGAGGYHYQFKWILPVPSADSEEEEAGIAPFPTAVPTAFRGAVEIVRRLDSGLTVVSADAAVRPSRLVKEVENDASSRVVNLDGLLSEVGPGRRYPDLLNRQALLRALSGMDPHTPDGEEQIAAVKAGGSQRLVFWPCEVTVERLLEGRLAEPLQVLREIRDDVSSRNGEPALVFVLPSHLAARLRRWLGREAGWFAPATIDRRWLGDRGFAQAESEAIEWLKGATALRENEAEEVFWRSGADLRVMHAWARKIVKEKRWRIDEIDMALMEWGRKDLAALDPFELAALLVISGAVTAESFGRLEAGMVLAQDVKTSVKVDSGNQPKTIGREGMVLTERVIRRLELMNPRPQTVRVGGIRETGGATDLPGEVAALHELLGGRLVETAKPLVNLGLAEKRGQITQATAFSQRVVQSAVRSSKGLEAAYRDLACEGHLLDGIALPRLREVSDVSAKVLGVGVSLARLVGRLWSDDAKTGESQRQRVVELVKELTGKNVRLLLHDSWPDHRCPLPEEGMTLVGADPSSTIGGFRQIFVWVSHSAVVDWGQADRWLGALAEVSDPGADRVIGERPLLILVGPNAEELAEPPRDRGIVVLRERDLRKVVAAEEVQKGLGNALRAFTNLVNIAPFKSEGALPPGSSIFVGRRRERKEVLAKVSACSFLVLGPRQIGKTSLLNAIFDDLVKEAPVVDGIASRPVLLSFQGVKSSQGIAGSVQEICKQTGVAAPEDASPIDLLRLVGAAYAKRGERPVYIVNEIDGMLSDEPVFLWRLRDLHETGLARFVFGGYVTVSEHLSSPTSPLFHFTSGLDGKSYFDLSVLSREEALELVDKLEAEPLGLRWQQPEERDEGRKQLVQRSYGVPWVIQDLCMQLVELLDEERRPVLRLDDVRRVVADRRPVLDHFNEIDMGELVDQKGDPAVRLAGRALLAQVAWRLYFSGGTPAVSDPRLRNEDPAQKSFTATLARAMLDRALDSWLGKGTPAHMRVQRFIQKLEVDRLFRGLTLTLILKEVGRTSGGEQSFAFQNHIYPLELARVEGGPEQRVADALDDLSRNLAANQGGTS